MRYNLKVMITEMHCNDGGSEKEIEACSRQNEIKAGYQAVDGGDIVGRMFRPGAGAFEKVSASGYVDKTGLLAYTNSKMGTTKSLLCVVRPRRFGKTYAARMVAAYYDNSVDTKPLFDQYKIAQDPSYEKYINKYNMIFFSVADFTGNLQDRKVYDEEKKEIRPATEDDIVLLIIQTLRTELLHAYPNAGSQDNSLVEVLNAVYEETGVPFYFVIDEWDAIYREFQENQDLQKGYSLFLRDLFKSNDTPRMIAGAYLTGILPMKRLGIGSAVTDFLELNMFSSKPILEYFGFTESEVRQVIAGSDLSYQDVAAWYDGYLMDDVHIFNPVSVTTAVELGRIDGYWNQSETYESLQKYINLNFDGLRDAISDLLHGKKIQVCYSNFPNDLTSIQTKNHVITLLIHLGYLTYDRKTESVSIPNLELYKQFQDTLEISSEYKSLYQKLKNADALLNAIVQGDSETAAKIIQDVHSECAPSRMYNNHEALKSTIREALVTSVNYYRRMEELPAGKGIADILYFPKPFSDKPALLVELKWDRSDASAIRQILNKEYPEALRGFCGKIQLVGVSYHPKSKKHTCSIQSYTIT